jgi:hypothetical protein
MMISTLAAIVVLVTTGLFMWAVSSLLDALLEALFPSKKAGTD